MKGGKRKGAWNVANDSCKREWEEITPKRREETLDTPCNMNLIIMRGRQI